MLQACVCRALEGSSPTGVDDAPATRGDAGGGGSDEGKCDHSGEDAGGSSHGSAAGNGTDSDRSGDDSDAAAGRGLRTDYYEDGDTYACPACAECFVDLDKFALHLDACPVGNPT